MILILLGIVIIGLGLVGIYYMVYKYDRDKFKLRFIDSPSTDSIIFSILFLLELFLSSSSLTNCQFGSKKYFIFHMSHEYCPWNIRN